MTDNPNLSCARRALRDARADLGHDLGGFSAVDLLLDQDVARDVEHARELLAELGETSVLEAAVRFSLQPLVAEADQVGPPARPRLTVEAAKILKPPWLVCNSADGRLMIVAAGEPEDRWPVVCRLGPEAGDLEAVLLAAAPLLLDALEGMLAGGQRYRARELAVLAVQSVRYPHAWKREPVPPVPLDQVRGDEPEGGTR